MRKINTKFFAFLVLLVALASGAVFGLHRLQACNIADALLWQANQAEKDGKLDRAARYLDRYLQFAREDLDELEHLGTILSDPQLATNPQRRARARFVIELVLAKDPQRHVLRQRLCRTLIAGRHFEAAKEHLTYLEKNLPASAEVPYLMGVWHEAQGQSVPALSAFRRALQSDAGKVEAYLHLVGLLKQADFGAEPRHADEIEQLVIAALEKAPHDAGILSLAAQHAQEKGDTRIALQYLEDGLTRNPSEPRLYLALARIHAQAGKRTEAIDKLQLGLRKVGKEHQYDLRWSLANLLLDDNRVDDVLPVIAQVRDANPVSADFLDARALLQRGRWFEAARQFEKVRPALKGTKELAYQVDLYLGGCYEQLDEPMLQLTAYERATQTDPTSLAARRGLAGARWALGQTGEALQIHQEIVNATKDPGEAALRRLDYARLLLQSGTLRHAKDFQKLAQELNDLEKSLVKSLDLALLRAELSFVQGDKNKAEELLQEAIKEHPNRHEPWLALIAIAATKNDPALTGQLMQTAAKKFNDKAEFRLGLIRFWSQRHDADTADALKRVENDITKFTPREQSALWQALAESYYDAGKHRDAQRALEQLVRLPIHAQDVRVRMQMLELALLQDDDAQARIVLGEIKRLEGDAAGGVDWNFGEAMRLIHAARKGNKNVLEQARHLLTVAAAQRPNWHPILQVRGELDELQGRPDQAIANYRRAIDLGSRDPLPQKQLIVLLSQAQRFDEVEQALLRMQNQVGATDEVVRYYVAHSCNRRDFRKAEALIRQIVASNSTSYRDHLWLGQILSATGHSPLDAEKAFRRAVELAPQQPEVWIGLVRHLIGVGKHVEAKNEIDKAKKALPSDRKELTLAQCFELAGFLRDAVDSYKSASESETATASACRAAGDFYVRVNLFADAEPLYRKVMARKVPASEEDVTAARRALAFALVKMSRPQQTAEALQLVGLSLDDQGLVPDSQVADALEERLAQARVLGSLHHHRLAAKAVALLEAMHQKNVLPAEDQFFLARLYAQQGTDAAVWAKARSLLKTLTLQQPKNPRYLSFAAQLHIQHKEFNDAEPIISRLEAVERERKATTGGFGSIELRAKMLELRGLGSQAVTLLTSYAEQPEAAPVRKLLLASLQGRLGNFRAAIDLCEEVHKTGSSSTEANGAAVAILRLNKPSEATPTRYEQWTQQRDRVETALRAALVKDAKNIPLHLHLADLMELQGKYDEVEKLCRAVLKEHDTNIVALNNLAWLLGQRPDRAAEALTLINRAIDRFGPRPELLDTRAIVQLNLGNVEQAVRDMERVVNEAPTPTRLFHLSRAHERARNTTSALALLRQANEQGLTMQQLHPLEQAEYQRVNTELGKQQ